VCSSDLRERWRELPLVTEVAEYAGQPSILISATQLGLGYSQTAARRIVSEWMDFFASGPSPIRELEFTSRTPKRLFETLAAQTQLERLEVKWGDYDDLAPLSDMTRLRELVLKGASSVTSVAPLQRLNAVGFLQLEGLKSVSGLAPIAEMLAVTNLDLGGDWMSPRIAHVDSIVFLERMPQVTDLLLHSIIVDDRDYSPLLRMPNLERVRVMKTRGMRPSFDELVSSLPWDG